MRYEESVKNIIEEFFQQGALSKSSFPEMELYMDQITGFMNQKLRIYSKDEDDQIMTKAMIANYVKHKLVPRPHNKKYNKEHLILLTFIHFLKNSFQMDEIENIMKPILENYYSEFDEKINLSEMYDSVTSLQNDVKEKLIEETLQDVNRIKSRNKQMELEDDDIIELFMLIIEISIKVDFERYLIQKLYDQYFDVPKKKAKSKK